MTNEFKLRHSWVSDDDAAAHPDQSPTRAHELIHGLPSTCNPPKTPGSVAPPIVVQHKPIAYEPGGGRPFRWAAAGLPVLCSPDFNRGRSRAP
jgi:hypothetical protein